MQADYAIIGGGVVGLSLGWGLVSRGHRVIVIDGDDSSFRASRGNFGLVWVQSKGLNAPHYARWSQGSAALWSGFAAELADASGTDLRLEQNGGYDLHLTEESLAHQVARYDALRDALGGTIRSRFWAAMPCAAKNRRSAPGWRARSCTIRMAK